MFKIGELIIYGTTGVCKVQGIGSLKAAGIPKDRMYYTLEPCGRPGSKIFTPVDNEKVIIRPVLGREEAMQMIEEIPEIEILWVKDEKHREFNYKEAVRTCDCRDLVKIIKTIYLRKQTRLAEGKKVTAVDEKYFHLAQDNLYGELAISLDMGKEEVKDFVVGRAGELETMRQGAGNS